MAFGRSSRPSTISMRKDWRAGLSKAFTRPSTALPAIRCQGSMWPLATSASIASDCPKAIVLVVISTLRLLRRSTKTPAKGASSRNGSCSAKVARPSQKAEPVSR